MPHLLHAFPSRLHRTPRPLPAVAPRAGLAVALASALALVAGPAQASQALAEAKSCTACHAVDKKLVGPAFKEVASRYAGQKDAAAKLAERIQKGSIPGKGNWGAIPMPANPQVSAADAQALANWVLGLK